ncbi:C2H2 type zinc finger protein [Phytophthora infestans]|uniref:C2H2 type zinc finger n=1 Tax=Phytophthora infestans TaxID=4787 RepID=A0A833W591_PHYIN|nr:C2H2 type zinc finger protein [Phytophthora infestans]KAF4127967.1 C2H2 type zinc finger [Phytophthora infestans]
MQDIQLDPIEIPADMNPKQNNSGSRAFQCPDVHCGRRFNRKYTLTEHMKTHTGERPHVCRARGCGKRFSTSGNLSRHMRLHGAIEPVHCPVKGCSSKFMSDIKLAKHMRTHYVPRTHTCKVPQCGKSFSTTGNLNRHLKNQHTEQDRKKYKTPTPSSPSLSFICSTPTNQKCSTPTRESPTGIDQEWTGNAWELASESTEMDLPAPFETACTTPWTPEMLDILSKMLLD